MFYNDRKNDKNCPLVYWYAQMILIHQETGSIPSGAGIIPEGELNE